MNLEEFNADSHRFLYNHPREDDGFIYYSREEYEGDEKNKPNDHCVWCYNKWIETDEHLRERLKKIKQDVLTNQNNI